jgi:hypothetical protein
LDLMWHRVLMCIRRGARRAAAALTRAWPELGAGQVGARGRRSQDRYGARNRESDSSWSDSDCDGGRRREWGQPHPGPSYL